MKIIIILLLLSSFNLRADNWIKIDTLPYQPNELTILDKDTYAYTFQHTYWKSISDYGFINGVSFTKDDGQTWKELIVWDVKQVTNKKDENWVYEFIFIDADTYMAYTKNGNLLKTTNSGISWDSVAYFEKPRSYVHFKSNDKLGILSCRADYAMITSDKGETWDILKNPLDSFAEKAYVIPEIQPFGNKIFEIVIENNGGTEMFVTSDKGKTWNKFGLPNSITSIESLDGQTIYGAGFVRLINGDGDGFERDIHTVIHKSTNGGKTWNKIYGNNIDEKSVQLEIISEDTLIAVVSPIKLIKTTDGGETWSEENFDKDVSKSLEDLKYANGSAMFTRTFDKSLYRSEGFSSVEFDENVILTIYPNINNGNFNLSLENEQIGAAVIEVIDLAGKKIYSQNLDKTSKKLEHNIQLNNLSNGKYILSLTINEKRSSQIFEIQK